MSEELPKTYDAKTNDEKWLKFWLERDFFKADPNSKKPAYCIVIPPPNVTGALHMGHALVDTLQDILIRWKRMSGFETLWVPGTDHAGISTQTVVERQLIKETGKRRVDFSREEFLAHTWAWKETYEERILGQLKKLGCSCDWSRLRFTMDKGNNAAVRKVFAMMVRDGLIYRGDYLVNWDPVTQTALADDEVEYEEHNSFIWTIRYPLSSGKGAITIATTRPETMLGDTAVAVHPSDERYTSLIGQTVVLPLTGRTIRIIGDASVDPEFGTGAVKITPAHDPNDYEMGLNHTLPFINIMTPDGRLNEKGLEWQGLLMEEAREKIVERLEKEGFLVKKDPHVKRVGVSYRSKAVIEPYMSKQWFVRMEGFKKRLQEVVKTKEVSLIPDSWENVYFHWINNLRDWCISRQLWWGHQIPIWYKKNDPMTMICYEGEGVPPEVEKEPDAWFQDPDVLDTWFSSALWPFATLGWPEKTPELEKFYPNSVLVTGHDILFFWVARMLVMGEYALKRPPFPEVFLHGLIFAKSYWRKGKDGAAVYLPHDERKEYELGKTPPADVSSRWEKMSKSKGNIIDPLEIIDDYGTDAMRMALAASATQAREIDLDRRRFEEFRNFTNKIWNGARFVFMNLSDLSSEDFSEGFKKEDLKLEDRWILSKLNHIVQQVNGSLEKYQFDQSALLAYDFFWKEFCAYYVEIVKPTLFGKVGTSSDRKNKQKLLAIVLLQSIRLLHPMAPFITEELFSLLKSKLGKAIINPGVDPYTKEAIVALHAEGAVVSPYPKVVDQNDIDETIEETFETVEEALYEIRRIRGEMQLPPGAAIHLYFVGKGTDPKVEILKHNVSIIQAMTATTKVDFVQDEPSLPLASTGVLHDIKILIPLPEEFVSKEKQRLEKEKEKILKQIERVRIQLANKDFVERAPEELIETQKALLEKHETEAKALSKKLLLLMQ